MVGGACCCSSRCMPRDPRCAPCPAGEARVECVCVCVCECLCHPPLRFCHTPMYECKFMRMIPRTDTDTHTHSTKIHRHQHRHKHKHRYRHRHRSGPRHNHRHNHTRVCIYTSHTDTSIYEIYRYCNTHISVLQYTHMCVLQYTQPYPQLPSFQAERTSQHP